MTDSELAEFCCRYNACCNEHRIADLGEFVARDVVMNDAEGGFDAYADALAVVVRAFPDYRWELRHLVVDAPLVAAHVTDTGTHRDTFLGVPAAGSPRSGVRPSTRTFSSSSSERRSPRIDLRILAILLVTGDAGCASGAW